MKVEYITDNNFLVYIKKEYMEYKNISTKVYKKYSFIFFGDFNQIIKKSHFFNGSNKIKMHYSSKSISNNLSKRESVLFFSDSRYSSSV